MIGELFNAVVDEVIGDDPATRRAAALPYIFSKYVGAAHGTGVTLSELSATPAPPPAPSAPGF